MKRSPNKPIQSIPEAIKLLKKEHKNYYGSYRLSADVFKRIIDPVFEFYIKEIERCLALIVQKNVTSKYTYIAEINHLKRFELKIELDDEVLFQDRTMLGIPLTEKKLKRYGDTWDYYAIGDLMRCFEELQDYFKYIENEGYKRVLSPKQIDDIPY